MKKVFTLMVVSMFLVAGGGMALAGEKAPQKVIDLAQSSLVKLGSDPVIVKAVQAENAKGLGDGVDPEGAVGEEGLIIPRFPQKAACHTAGEKRPQPGEIPGFNLAAQGRCP